MQKVVQLSTDLSDKVTVEDKTMDVDSASDLNAVAMGPTESSGSASLSLITAEHGRSMPLPSAQAQQTHQHLEQMMATQFSNIGQKFDAILEHLVKRVCR